MYKIQLQVEEENFRSFAPNLYIMLDPTEIVWMQLLMTGRSTKIILEVT